MKSFLKRLPPIKIPPKEDIIIEDDEFELEQPEPHDVTCEMLEEIHINLRQAYEKTVNKFKTVGYKQNTDQLTDAAKEVLQDFNQIIITLLGLLDDDEDDDENDDDYNPKTPITPGKTSKKVKFL